MKTMSSVALTFIHWDERLIKLMTAYGITLLRISLGFVFIWFGLLKVIGKSPVEELVANTVYWIGSDFFVPLLGAWEMVVGLGLAFGFLLRLTLLLFWLQMAGTFLVLVIRPDLSFQSANLLLLTVEGEFVVKNLVLITAGIVIGSTVNQQRAIRKAA